eukprot:1352471-Lingulodinium_polyedra.AAC.1
MATLAPHSSSRPQQRAALPQPAYSCSSRAPGARPRELAPTAAPRAASLRHRPRPHPSGTLQHTFN